MFAPALSFERSGGISPRALPIHLNLCRKRRNSMKAIKAVLLVAVLALGLAGAARASASCCDTPDCCASGCCCK